MFKFLTITVLTCFCCRQFLSGTNFLQSVSDTPSAFVLKASSLKLICGSCSCAFNTVYRDTPVGCADTSFAEHNKMALVGTEQLSRDSSEIKSEILPDGTLHCRMSLTRTRSNSLKKVAETIETFECPPHLVVDKEEIEEIMPDGTKVVRKVSLNRVVHSIKTRREACDGCSPRVVEDYEVEEVVPNTLSAFDTGVDSDYEEEMEMKKKAHSLSVDMETEEIEEVLPDGTKVTRQVTLNRVVHTPQSRRDSLDSRDGNIHEEYPTEEVVPGTLSAFAAGQDSD